MADAPVPGVLGSFEHVDGASDAMAPAGDAECAGPARSALGLAAPALPE